VSLLPFCGKTWSPVGEPPLLLENKKREHLSILAAMSTNAELWFEIKRGAFKGKDVAEFCHWMHQEVPLKKFAIVWDGANIHKSHEIKELLKEKPGIFHLEQLPAYSPELNPIELLWAYLKTVKLKNRVFLNLDELEIAIEKALFEIADDTQIIFSFFSKKSVGNIF
jgi:transposase